MRSPVPTNIERGVLVFGTTGMVYPLDSFDPKTAPFNTLLPHKVTKFFIQPRVTFRPTVPVFDPIEDLEELDLTSIQVGHTECLLGTIPIVTLLRGMACGLVILDLPTVIPQAMLSIMIGNPTDREIRIKMWFGGVYVPGYDNPSIH